VVARTKAPKLAVVKLPEYLLVLGGYIVTIAKLIIFNDAGLDEVAGETKAALLERLPAPLQKIPLHTATTYLEHCIDGSPDGFMFNLQSQASQFGKLLTDDDLVALFAVCAIDMLKQGVDIDKPAALHYMRTFYIINAQAKKAAELSAADALALSKRANNRNEFRRDGPNVMIHDRRQTRPRMDDYPYGNNPYGNTRDTGRYTDRYTDRREPSRANEAYVDSFQGCTFFARKGWCQAEPCRGCAHDRRSHAARVAMIPAGTPPWRGSSSIPRAHAPRQPTAAPTPGAPAATPAARRRPAAAAP
jgi:hypothetical protein